MNATTTPAKAQTVSLKPSKTVKAPRPIATEAQQFLMQCRLIGFQVQDLLLNAASIDTAEEESGNGDSYRFTRLAAQALATLEPDQAETWSICDHAETILDAIALIDAACDCNGDSIGADRIALYEKSRAMLCEVLTGTEYSAPARKPAAKHTQAAYTRPLQTYFPDIGKTAEERLRTLRATLQTADEKLEAAYDAVERGTVVDTLLDLINHDLLCRAANPVIMGVAGARQPDRTDLNQTYLALFPVLAALEGAMALSMGTVVHSTIADAYNLLEWVHNECDSAALGKLLPAFDPSAAFNRGRDLAIGMLVKADETGHRREGWRRFREGQKQENIFESVFDAVVDDSTLMPGFCAVMSATMRNDEMDLALLKTITLAETQAGTPGDDGTEADDAIDTSDAVEVETVTSADKPKAEWWRLDLIDGELNSAEIMNDMILDTCQFAYTDPDECERAQERIILLARAVDNYVTSARNDLQEAITLAQKAGHA